MKCSRHTLNASLAAHVSSQNQSLQGIPVANALRACEGPRRAQSDRQDEKGNRHVVSGPVSFSVEEDKDRKIQVLP